MCTNTKKQFAKFLGGQIWKKWVSENSYGNPLLKMLLKWLFKSFKIRKYNVHVHGFFWGGGFWKLLYNVHMRYYMYVHVHCNIIYIHIYCVYILHNKVQSDIWDDIWGGWADNINTKCRYSFSLPTFPILVYIT